MALIPRLAKLADQNDDEFFSALSQDERQTLLGLLKRIAERHQLNTLPTS